MAQVQAKAVTTFFRDRMPLVIYVEIEAIENELWEEVQTIPMEEIQSEVEEWVMDPRATTGRASTYDMMIMVYWVMKNLMAHVAMSGEGKIQGGLGTGPGMEGALSG